MRYWILIPSFAIAQLVLSQGAMPLSLQRATDLAAEQSYAVRNSALEAEKAIRREKEILAIGLPQLNASGSLQNYLDVPTSVVPNFFGNDPEFLEVQFGVPWTTTGGLRLDQLLFDGSYLVGLAATKELRKQSDEELEQAEKEARITAAKAYYAVLAAEEGARLLKETVPVLERSYTESKALFENGFAESTDVDRLELELQNTRDRVTVFERQAEVANAYLLFVLGLPIGTELDLTDPLQTLIDAPGSEELLGSELNMDAHVDHRIAATYERLQVLNVKNEKSAYLPKLRGFFSYQQQAFGNAEVVDSDWYPASLWGLNLDVPLFSSGSRSNKVAQAKLTLEQAQVNLERVEQQLSLEVRQRRSDLQTARDLYENARDRLELSRKIFERTSTKYTEGLSSSFELNTEQSSYIQSQVDYVQRVADYLNARTELRRSLDLF
ncbi:MAG: TolC family protein [Flavobacteriales bacterium]|nr:TolC family protein [Flavobacteriales bacterium]